MRPSGLTAVASVITRPAPPCASAPRCTRCQSVASPSRPSAEYWHIGDTHTRFGTVRSRMRTGWNSAASVTGSSTASGGSAIPVEREASAGI